MTVEQRDSGHDRAADGLRPCRRDLGRRRRAARCGRRNTCGCTTGSHCRTCWSGIHGAAGQRGSGNAWSGDGKRRAAPAAGWRNGSFPSCAVERTHFPNAAEDVGAPSLHLHVLWTYWSRRVPSTCASRSWRRGSTGWWRGGSCLRWGWGGRRSRCGWVGRLHRLHRGVYAVGHRVVSREGRWMAAVLFAGPGRCSVIARRRRSGGSGRVRAARSR